MEYSFNNDYLSLITETTNFTSPVYKEAAEAVDKNTNKGMAYFKNFMTSIEKLADKPQVKDSRITSSKGNIKNFQGYENIKTAITFINKNLSGIAEVKDCVKVFDALENWASLYEEGYTSNIRLIQLEYENAVFMLSTSLSEILANNMDVVANGTEIRITKKAAESNGVIQKTMKDLATKLGNRDHKDYLEGLIKSIEVKATESVYSEGVLDTTVETLKLIKGLFSNVTKIFKAGSSMFNTFKRTLFGIVPLIRSIMYLRYKKKADTIVSLEEQIIFIERNIDQLKNIKTMDPAKKEVIIKKQQAVIEQYKKKSAKLRAQLMETEKQATEAAKKDEPELKNTSDDLVLESAVFTEKGMSAKAKNFMKTNRNISKKEIQEVRFDKKMDKLTGIRHTAAMPEGVKDSEVEAKVKKAFDLYRKNTSKPSIRLIPGKGYNKEDTSYKGKVLTTKIGGTPYWPVDEEWPTYKGTPMVCLAQLDLSKLPSIPGYPTKGLLQFFIIGGDEWGEATSCKVIYRTDTSKEYMKEVPRTTINDKYDSYPPIDAIYYPKVVKQDQFMTPADDEFHTEVVKAVNEVFKTDYKKYVDIPSKIYDAFWECLKFGDYDGCRFGGHPYFTQNDVRNDHYSELLLQLDSESGMMWGDCGVANFFISKENLAKKNFDDVYFTWDCC